MVRISSVFFIFPGVIPSVFAFALISVMLMLFWATIVAGIVSPYLITYVGLMPNIIINISKIITLYIFRFIAN